MSRDRAYCYQPIQDDESIRLLVLDPGQSDTPLCGKLRIVKANDAGSYEAISYVWSEPGPPACKYEILLQDHDNGGLLQLRGGNLFAALRQLRSPDQRRVLWADQVCINQDDLIERGQQVQFMNRIYKNASRVLVWLGLDTNNEAAPAFHLVRQIYEKLLGEDERKKFHVQFTEQLEQQPVQEWDALQSLTNKSWFKRGWIVQEIGTPAPATLFWGKEEIDWEVLSQMCEELTHYHLLRNKFNIQTSDIKFLYQRFVEPDGTSYHANRFNLVYELHRARGVNFTDQRDRVFGFLGHYAHQARTLHGNTSAAIQASYTTDVKQVFVDTARWALANPQAGSALIALAAVQHMTLPSKLSNNETFPSKHELPSWVADWRTYQSFILSEPICQHSAHGNSEAKFEISDNMSILRIYGLAVDSVETCSRKLLNKEFHSKKDQGGGKLPVEYLWREICHKSSFNLGNDYVDGQQAFFAFAQTLSNGCAQVAGKERKKYSEIPDSRWLEQAALYLHKAMGKSENIDPAITNIAEKAQAAHVEEQWSRLANGASKNRKFARTKKGYYVLGPAVMEEGDIICVLFGGKLPFCLRPWGQHFLLVGECYVHGLMKGEAMTMLARKEVVEQEFELV